MRSLPAVFLTIFLLASSTAVARAQTAPATPQQTSEKARRKAFFRNNLVEAYETVGRHNHKWDAKARKILALAAQRWMNAVPDPDLDWQIVMLGHEAAEMSCDDPAVLYHDLNSRTILDGTHLPPYLDVLDHGISESKYAPFIKVSTWVLLVEFMEAGLEKKDPAAEAVVRRSLKDICNQLPGMMAEKDFPQEKIANICVDLTDTGKILDGDRKPSIDMLFEIMQRAQPKSPVADLFKGLAYRKYAWDARGNGFAGTVTDEGWRLLNERLTVSKDSFNRALSKDPNCAPAAAEMIGALLGADEGRAEMEKYFQRAIIADPDCYAAYDNKLYYLTTKWHGTAKDQLEFGRACLATKRWETRIPFLLLQAQRNMVEGRFRELCEKTDDAAACQKAWGQAIAELYAATPNTWKDVQDLYDGYLAWNPNAVTERVNYAKAAIVAGHLDIVQQQLDHLDKVANTDPLFKIIIGEQEKGMRAALIKAGATVEQIP